MNTYQIKIITLTIMTFLLMSCNKYVLNVMEGTGSGEYPQGTIVEISANQAKYGYTFYRWDGDFKHVTDRYNKNTTVKIDRTSLTLKATFVSSDQTYFLTVNNGSGTGEYLPGDDVQIRADLPIPPEEFYKWKIYHNLEDLNINVDQLDNTEFTIKMPKRNISITATYDILYSLIIIKGTGPSKLPEGHQASVKADPAPEDYVFDKWIGDTDKINNINQENINFLMPANSIELEATYKLEKKYKLTVVNGTGSGTFKASSQQRITANPEPAGSVFTGWTGDTDVLFSTKYKTYVISMPQRDIELIATYEKAADYSVTVGKGIGDGRYQPGDKVTIEADIAPDGFIFSSWSGDTYLLSNNTTPKITFIMPEKNINFTASYEKETIKDLHFNIIFQQLEQPCGGCGIWFDAQGNQHNNAKLIIEYTSKQGEAKKETYQYGLNNMSNAFSFFLGSNNNGTKHSILVKKGPRFTGLFFADIGNIPHKTNITKATLHLHLHTHEGLSYSDSSSVLSVHQCDKKWNWDEATWTHYNKNGRWDHQGGDFGEFIREIRAKEDLIGQGCSKHNPNCAFDFTDYVKKLVRNR